MLSLTYYAALPTETYVYNFWLPGKDSCHLA